MTMKAAAWRLLMAMTCSVVVQAAPPGFDSLFPAGGKAGSQVEVKAAGTGRDKGAPKTWTSDPLIQVSAGGKPRQFLMSIAAEAAPGPRLMRFYTDEGTSPPRIIEVGSFEEVLEQEPNDRVTDAQEREAKMNVTINGVLEKAGDVDTYALSVHKGRRVTLELRGYSLGSPMDPAMRLLDTNGIEVSISHDTHNLDPRIEYTPAADGTMYAQVFAFAHPPAADVTLKGSANHVYRLIVSDKPIPEPVIDEPETLTLPAAVTGRIGKPREADRFTFTATKGDELRIAVRARVPRSPLDATLSIEDANGKPLQQTDDTEHLDPVMRWKTPADGEYRVVVADRYHHGGEEYAYDLTVQPFEPSLSATLNTHAYQMKAGGKVEIPLTIKIDGVFKGKIQARAISLPAGVSVPPVEVPAKGGEVKLTLTAAADAAPSQGPFAVEITSSAPDAEQTVLASYAIPFNEPRGDLWIPRDTQPWLTVLGGTSAEKKKSSD